MAEFDYNLIRAMAPELLLIGVACVLFLLGVSSKAAARRIAPVLAAAALIFVFGWQITAEDLQTAVADRYHTFRVFEFAVYIKMLAAGVGVLFVLLAWPTNQQATGNSALDFGPDAGEFFALMLLSIAGVMLVAGANDMILLFLGLELASIPTYILVSISRPLPVAQEAGVKYFFLGAMAAAVMLFGFSYLYGTTGTTSLVEITGMIASTAGIGTETTTLSPWQQLAVTMLVAGFAFKIAAVPLHFYAGDVYQGAATPITAFLSFVPKASGMVALIKLITVAGGGQWAAPEFLQRLLWVLAVLTMTVGNVLGLLQFNIKRVLAYSSIAHSGYMLVGLATMSASRGGMSVRQEALEGVLFYLAAYGIMNAAAFGVLMLLPARPSPGFRPGQQKVLPATSAETFEDLAGTGRRHVLLGLAMAISCFSLIGLPLTVGFFGKLFLIRPALLAATEGSAQRPWMIWLVVITMINAAISAAYYLKIVGTMFLRPEPTDADVDEEGAPVPAATAPAPLVAPFPVVLAIGISAFGTLLFGALMPATEVLSVKAKKSASLDVPYSAPLAAETFESAETPAEPEAAAASQPR